MNIRMLVVTAAAVVLTSTCSAHAGFVYPMYGGGQLDAPMIHLDVMFDGANLSANLDTSHGVPNLVPLTPPDSFDPAEGWAVLNDKAYNYQYAPNPGGFFSLPAGTWIWFRQLSATPGLEAYQRSPATPPWAPIFGTAGSPLIWKWSGGMTHNAYAVYQPTLSTYSATYKIYIGDINTGAEILDGSNNPVYGSVQKPLTWNATPVPEPASLAVLALGALVQIRRRRHTLLSGDER